MDMMSLRRRVLVNQNKLVSATGNPITFNTPLTKPLKECVVRFTPKQEGSGTPSPENVREIVGKNGITVYQQGDDGVTHETSVSFPAVGKNLFDISKADIEESGIAFGGNVSSPQIDGSLYLEAGTYTASFSGTAFLISASRSNSTVIKSVLNSSSLTFTLEETQAVRIIFAQIEADDMTAYQYQLEKGSTATAYEPFDNTVYGGYVDLVNGEVVAEWTKVDMGERNWAFTWNTFNTAPSNYIGNGVSGTPTEVVCDIYPSDINAPATEVGRIDKNIRGRANYKHICIRDDDYTSVADFKIAVTGHYLAYKLAEPIHYPLSSLILTTLRGNNVMWSDANGDITVRYWTR